MSRRAITAVLLASILAAGQARAQEPDPPSGTRRYILALVGAAALGGLAMVAGEGHEGGQCADRKCLGVVGVTLGGMIGYMVGSDLDRRARERWSPLAELEPSGRRSVGLPGLPHRILPGAGGLLVLDAERLHRLGPDLRATALTPALRPRDALVLPGGQHVLVVSGGGLFRAGLTAGLPVDTFGIAGGTALSRAGEAAVAVGGAGSLRRLRLEDASAPEAERSAELEGVPQALVADEAGRLWLIAADRLESRDPATLESIGSLTLVGPAFALSVSGRLGLAALGRAGVAVVDLNDPARPELLATLTGARHAYAAILLNGRIYVAAGSQGVLVFDATDPRAPRPVGRLTGFKSAVDVLARDGRLHVLDRGERRLHVIEP